MREIIDVMDYNGHAALSHAKFAGRQEVVRRLVELAENSYAREDIGLVVR